MPKPPQALGLGSFDPSSVGAMAAGGYHQNPDGSTIPMGAAAVQANAAITTNATQIGGEIAAQMVTGAVLSRLPGRWPGGGAPWNTISESPSVCKQVNKLTTKQKQAYQALLDLLAQGRAGKNQHPLGGNRAGQFAADLVCTGKGRGSDRVIFTIKDGLVEIIAVGEDYH